MAQLFGKLSVNLRRYAIALGMRVDGCAGFDGRGGRSRSNKDNDGSGCEKNAHDQIPSIQRGHLQDDASRATKV
jgi:hypothetical protein